MPKGITDGVGPPMTPHYVFLKFHLILRNFSGLLKLVQGHITLHTKGMPRPLKVMRLEHLDYALIHLLQQRRGVRRQEDKLDVLMQVLQHGVGGSIVEDHQDMEGEALRRTILLQLVHPLRLAVGLENVTRHPTVDRQADLDIVLECTRVLSVVDQNGLQLAVSRQVSPQQKGETVLKCHEPGPDFSSLMMYVRSGIFIHCRPVSFILNLLGLDDGPETIRVESSGVFVSAFSLSRVLNIMKPLVGLKLVKSAHACVEFCYGVRLLLQVVEALHGFLFGVVEGHVQALTLPIIHPCD